MKELLEQCISILHFQAEVKGIYVKLEIEQGTPTVIYTDQNRLRQIIINLLSNAVKYTIKGFIKISMRKMNDNSGVCIQVQDTGVGISKE